MCRLLFMVEGCCVARVSSGALRMRACMALDDADVANGLVLSCQALPTTPAATVDVD